MNNASLAEPVSFLDLWTGMWLFFKAYVIWFFCMAGAATGLFVLEIKRKRMSHGVEVLPLLISIVISVALLANLLSPCFEGESSNPGFVIAAIESCNILCVLGSVWTVLLYFCRVALGAEMSRE